MRTSFLGRSWSPVGAAAALLAACGGTEPATSPAPAA
jgi:hypothetical protein